MKHMHVRWGEGGGRLTGGGCIIGDATDLLIRMFEGTTLSYVWTIIAEREKERERETTFRRRHTHRHTIMHSSDQKFDLKWNWDGNEVVQD